MDRPDELRHYSLSRHGRMYILYRQSRFQELQQSKEAQQRVDRVRTVEYERTSVDSIHKSKKEHLLYAYLAQRSLFRSRITASLHFGFFVRC